MLFITSLLSFAIFIIGVVAMVRQPHSSKGGYIALLGLMALLLSAIFFYRDNEGLSVTQYPWLLAVWLAGLISCCLVAVKAKLIVVPQNYKFIVYFSWCKCNTIHYLHLAIYCRYRSCFSSGCCGRFARLCFYF